MKEKKVLTLATSIFMSVTLTNCTNMRDLTPTEFQTQEFYQKSVRVNKSINEIKEVFASEMPNRIWQGGRVRSHIKISPSKDKAIIWWETGGFAKMATMALMDFQQDVGNPNVTNVKLYSANSMWGRQMQEFLDLL